MVIRKLERGVGHYDDQATVTRILTEADGVIVMVFGGKRGDGFSLQTADPDLDKRLPDILRYLANEIEKENEKWERN